MKSNSEEGKVAIKIVNLLNKVDLDLDRVGIEIARIEPKIHYNRMLLVTEAAIEEVKNGKTNISW